MSWTLPTELENYSQIKASIKEFFQLQINEGFLYYRNAPDKANRLEDKSDVLSASELSAQCSWLIMRNAIYLMCQCCGNQNSITRLLDNNFSLESIAEKRHTTDEMMSNIESIVGRIRSREVATTKQSITGFKTEKNEEMLRVMNESEVSDDVVIDIINSMPKKQLLKWVSYSINTNIIPFRYEMYKLIGV